MAGSKAHFAVSGKFSPRGFSDATVTIDRQNNFITVRPKWAKHVYEMRLEDVAEWIMWKTIAANLTTKKKEKAERKKQRRLLR